MILPSQKVALLTDLQSSTRDLLAISQTRKLWSVYVSVATTEHSFFLFFTVDIPYSGAILTEIHGTLRSICTD